MVCKCPWLPVVEITSENLGVIQADPGCQKDTLFRAHFRLRFLIFRSEPYDLMEGCQHLRKISFKTVIFENKVI